MSLWRMLALTLFIVQLALACPPPPPPPSPPTLTAVLDRRAGNRVTIQVTATCEMASLAYADVDVAPGNETSAALDVGFDTLRNVVELRDTTVVIPMVFDVGCAVDDSADVVVTHVDLGFEPFFVTLDVQSVAGADGAPAIIKVVGVDPPFQTWQERDHLARVSFGSALAVGAAIAGLRDESAVVPLPSFFPLRAEYPITEGLFVLDAGGNFFVSTEVVRIASAVGATASADVFPVNGFLAELTDEPSGISLRVHLPNETSIDAVGVAAGTVVAQSKALLADGGIALSALVARGDALALVGFTVADDGTPGVHEVALTPEGDFTPYVADAFGASALFALSTIFVINDGRLTILDVPDSASALTGATPSTAAFVRAEQAAESVRMFPAVANASQLFFVLVIDDAVYQYFGADAPTLSADLGGEHLDMIQGNAGFTGYQTTSAEGVIRWHFGDTVCDVPATAASIADGSFALRNGTQLEIHQALGCLP